MIDQEAAGGDDAAEEHGAVLSGDFASGLGHSVPAEAEAVAVRLHHPGDRDGVGESAGEIAIDHGPDAEALAEKERAGHDGRGHGDGHERRQGEAVEGVEYRRAVDGDAGDEDNRQEGIEEMDGEIELGGREMGGDEGEEAARGERHEGGGGDKQETHPEHGAREQLLRAVVAFALSDADQGGNEGLIHGLGDEVDEQAGDERGGEEGVHGVGAAVDAGDGKLLDGGDEFDEDGGGGDRSSGAKDLAIGAGALERASDLGKGEHGGAGCLASLQEGSWR